MKNRWLVILLIGSFVFFGCARKLMTTQMNLKSPVGDTVFVKEKASHKSTKGVVLLIHPYTGPGHLYYDIPVTRYYMRFLDFGECSNFSNKLSL